MTDQNILRANMLKRRRALKRSEIEDAALLVLKHFKALPCLNGGGKLTIASYAALKGELDPNPANEFAKALGHRIALPKVNPSLAGSMDFYAVDSPLQLTPGCFGIMEPDPDKCAFVDEKALDLVLLPLVAFDQEGNRLGMGGGYYDRLLKKIRPDCLRIGLGYDFQRVDVLKHEIWDMPLDMAITPSGTVAFKKPHL